MTKQELANLHATLKNASEQLRKDATIFESQEILPKGRVYIEEVLIPQIEKQAELIAEKYLKTN